MRTYCNLDVVWASVYPMADSPAVRRLNAQLEPPYFITWLHVLHVDYLFHTRAQSAAPDALEKLRAGQRQWQHWLDEGIFDPDTPVHWEAALQRAANWNREQLGKLLPPAALLDPALAAESGCEVFYSLNPSARKYAARAGLRLFPERLV